MSDSAAVGGIRTRGLADEQNPPSDSVTPPADYKVGYRRPPANSQFKKGQSGNPSGRPKGSKNLKTLFDEELSSRVSIREGNKTRHASKREVIVKRTVNKAAEGDPKATEIILRVEGFAQRGGRGLAGAGDSETVDPQQDQIDQETVRIFIDMVLEAAKGGKQLVTDGDDNDRVQP